MLVEDGVGCWRAGGSYEENPFELHDTGNYYNPVFGAVR